MVEFHLAGPRNRDTVVQKRHKLAERGAQFFRALSHEPRVDEEKIAGNESPNPREPLLRSRNRKAAHQRIDDLGYLHPRMLPLRGTRICLSDQDREGVRRLRPLALA